MFTYYHLVQFYETDLMRIVHHTNYLRFIEEARVAWAVERGLIDYSRPESASEFAVYETRVKHLKPTFFGDKIAIDVQARQKGVRVFCQYRLRRGDDVVCLAETVHVSLDAGLKAQRLSDKIISALEKEQWTETWL